MDYQQRGCARCGAVVHVANYPRKPRGLQADVEPGVVLRHSFCCSRDGCRRRLTPPSMRFLGPKVYAAPIVLVAAALLVALALARLPWSKGHAGVPARTARRWSHFFREDLPRQPVWLRLTGAFVPPLPSLTLLPLSLLARWGPLSPGAVDECLRAIASLTTRCRLHPS